MEDFEFKNDHVVIHTDGACENNGQENARAGFGVWFGANHRLNVSSPVQGRPTSNIAELEACITALQIAQEANIRMVEIRTDSEYVINCMTEWITSWKKNNWKKYNGDVVKHKDYVIKLDALVNQFDHVQWSHVRGHSGIQGNKGADQLARKGRN